MFSKKYPIREIAAKINRAESTTVQYLVEFIQQENISNPYAWVKQQTAKNIHRAVRKIGSKQLKLIFDYLNGQVDYKHNPHHLGLPAK